MRPAQPSRQPWRRTPPRRCGWLSVLLLLQLGMGTADPVKVGSKAFTESVILGEIITGTLRHEGIEAEHLAQLGGSRILFEALKRGDLDIYPEYTGTLCQELVREQMDGRPCLAHLEAVLAEQELMLGKPLGFNNSYALGMRESLAASLNIRRISDLREHPDLVFGFGNEFMDRGDGWPALRARYALPHGQVRGMDHDLAYRALVAEEIDLIDVYSTDAEIQYYGLRVLEDDFEHFPRYDAVLLMRASVSQDSRLRSVLEQLSGSIDGFEMQTLNARVKLDGQSEAEVAARHLGITAATRSSTLSRVLGYVLEHLVLVGLSLAAAILLALPMGIVAAYRPRLGQWVLGLTGVLQTIPSLALFVFMIPLFGIGAPPALAALFLYSLLPIVRNTHAGISGIPKELRESAQVLGLKPMTVLTRIELPLATRDILAGIKIAAVINVGTATLGALIGAGGLGQPILTGIRLDDTRLILEGAIPAATLALAVQALFDLAERRLTPRGLRL